LELDFEAVASDLVRALRGRRSQPAFSRRLGYRSNVVYTWESGRRWPSASTFLRAAARIGVDLNAAISSFHRGDPPWLSALDPASPEGVAALLDGLRGDVAVGRVAERAGRSRFATARWLKGGAEPRLPDLLRVVEATSLRALDFVALFADPALMPSTRAPWSRLQGARALAWASPWSQAVVLALELADYRALLAHDDAWLAGRLGVPEAVVREAIEALSGAGHLRRDGARLAPVEVRSVDLRAPRSGNELKLFWADIARERLRSGATGVFSYNLFSVSEVDLARLEEMHRAHYRAVRELVASSAPSERVVLLQLQLVPLSG
jgi:transcriptional regulator with XRE-family HTH domain